MAKSSCRCTTCNWQRRARDLVQDLPQCGDLPLAARDSRRRCLARLGAEYGGELRMRARMSERASVAVVHKPPKFTGNFRKPLNMVNRARLYVAAGSGHSFSRGALKYEMTGKRLSSKSVALNWLNEILNKN